MCCTDQRSSLLLASGRPFNKHQQEVLRHEDRRTSGCDGEHRRMRVLGALVRESPGLGWGLEAEGEAGGPGWGWQPGGVWGVK